MSLNDHPLLQGEATCIRDWEDWKKHWAEATLTEYRHSLLHFGFSVPLGGRSYEETQAQREDRVCFYLDLADGHVEARNFMQPHERGRGGHFNAFETALGRVSYPGHLKHMISQRAFEILCRDLFKERRDGPMTTRPWNNDVTYPTIFKKVLWFFRLEGNKLTNLGDKFDPHSMIARDFVFKFCESSWKYRADNQYPGPRDHDVQRMFQAARLQLTQMLYGIGKISVLIKEYEYPLDLRTLLWLKDVAMDDSETPIFWDSRNYRKPQTLQEALVADNAEVARVLFMRLAVGKQYVHMKRAHTKQLKIQQLEAQVAKMKA